MNDFQWYFFFYIRGKAKFCFALLKVQDSHFGRNVVRIMWAIFQKEINWPATGGRLGGRAPGGGTGGRRFTGAGLMRLGGGGSPGGGGGSTPGIGGGWKGSILGKITSSTTTGSLPWSNGHMSPLMQKPFSEKEQKRVNQHEQTQPLSSFSGISPLLLVSTT